MSTDKKNVTFSLVVPTFFNLEMEAVRGQIFKGLGAGVRGLLGEET